MKKPQIVKSAENFLGYCVEVQYGSGDYIPLSKMEEATKNAALEVIRNYFTGEMCYDKKIKKDE